jgi:hypothetical protein
MAASRRPLCLSLLEHHIPWPLRPATRLRRRAPLRETALCLGASHAQCDLLELTLPAEHWRARVAR